MSLSEAQVVRYSRQILLAQVGGMGQERLLASGAQLVGSGAAQAAAAAYLAAGGIAVCAESIDAPVRAEEAGFLFGAQQAGQAFAVALNSAVGDLNPDARTGRISGSLGEVPASFSGPAPWVALGWRENRAEVVYRSESGCAECFSASLRRLSSVPSGPHAILLGTVGALVFQRLCLDGSDALGSVSIESGGEIQSAELSRCPRCQ